MSHAVHYTVIAGVAGTIVLGGCRSPQPSAPIAKQLLATPVASARVNEGDGPPSALTQAGESAENLFDLARLSKWHDAAAAVQDLRESASALPSIGLKPADLDSQLRSRIRDLEGSVTARRRVQSMDLANSITQLVADLSAPYQAEIPYKIVLLGYYGRQLELGLVASRPSTIKRAAADVRQTWGSVERSVLQHGDVDDARRFTDIVVQIEGAQRPADLVAPVRAELAAVDRLKKIFTP